MNHLKLEVHDYLSISKVRPDEPSIVISINEPNMDPPYLYPTFIDKHHVFVHDVDDVNFAEKNGYIVLSKDQATKIIKFVDKYRKAGINKVYVHCLAGVSRSAGTAAALSKIYNDDDSYFFTCGKYHPNSHIRSLILDAAIEEGIWNPHGTDSQAPSFSIQ